MLSDGVITTLLVLSVLVGIGGASYMVFRSPAFWGDVLTELANKAWPRIKEVLTRRMTPEEEASWREAEKAGRGEEWLRKRRGAPPKG